MTTSPEVQAALIAGIVAVFGTIITMIIAKRTFKSDKEKIMIEQQKLDNDRKRMDAEIAKLNIETEKTIIDAYDIRNLQSAEVSKLIAETKKTLYEMNHIKNTQIINDAEKIRNLLILFDRKAFNKLVSSEDPLLLLRAIIETRINMQKMGASFIYDIEVSNAFNNIKNILIHLEDWVSQNIPKLNELAEDIEIRKYHGVSPDTFKGINPYEFVDKVISARSDINRNLHIVEKNFREIEQQTRNQPDEPVKPLDDLPS
ncbi:MAG TPA: hypothetical protein DEF47_22115 [Herpetosiphon sp.]|nr:hypothetical protein [Herpetosiphon sp.]HBW52585.1 hypothetical protein [Herpetosiphon sp.]